MEVRCEYCGSMIDDKLDKCPNCGAPNEHMARAASKIPATIEELQAFCRKHNLNLEKMHFHIGENYTGPRAFGIYKSEDGEFIVYKNKSDGSRAVRYHGRDEAYAVNEIYQKMKAEILEVRENSVSHGTPRRSTSSRATPPPYVSSYSSKKKPGCGRGCLIAVIVFFAIAILAAILEDDPKQGYYQYDGTTYYSNGSHWYTQGTNGWYQTDVPYDLDTNFGDYFDDDYSGDSFSYNYDKDNNWDDDWDDDDWDWDWGNDDDDDDWDWDDDDDDWDDWDDWGNDYDWDSDW